MAKRGKSNQLSDFGAKFEAWRREHGLSQAVVAQLIGTSQRTLSDWTKADGMPGAVYQIARLAALMDQDVSGLIEGDAPLAPLRDQAYIQRVLTRLASPAVVERYVKRSAQEPPRGDRMGEPS